MYRTPNPDRPAKSPRSAEWDGATLVDRMRSRAAEQREELAYRFMISLDGREETVSFGQLDQRARALAVRLQEMKMAGQRAMLLLPPGLEYIVAFFGCLYAGVIAVPAYPPRPKRSSPRLRAIAGDCHARMALTLSDQLVRLQQSSSELTDLSDLVWLTVDDIPADAAIDWRPPAIDPSSVAFLQYTSGSTDQCKGVMLSHGNLMHNLAMIRHGFRVNPAGMGVSWLPMHHDMGLIGGVLEPLFVGGPATLFSPAAFLQRPALWLETISRYRGTISGAPNFAYDLCVEKVTEAQRHKLDLSSWETAYCGAEPIRAETLQRFADAFGPCGFRRDAFYPCFGLAESTLIVTGRLGTGVPVSLSLDKRELESHRVVPPTESDGQQTLVACGMALLGQEVMVVDPKTRLRCDEDRVGEIWVAGPSVAQGYWNLPDETQKTFHAYESGSGQGPFLRTGDLGFVHQGQLFVTGRLKDLIIIRGRNLYPQDIERTVRDCRPQLRSSPGAAFSVTIGGREQLVIVQEVERGFPKSEADEVAGSIHRAVSGRHGIRPYTVAMVRPFSIPMTSSGKIRRSACRQAYLDDTLKIIGGRIAHTHDPAAAARGAETAPSGGRKEPSGTPASTEAIQAWLVQQIAERVPIEASRIDPQQPFEHLGLDSLTAVQLTGDLATFLGRELSPTLVYDYPNIRSLARHLAGLPGDKPRQARLQQPAVECPDPIAIVGMACRFPGGANDPRSYWNLLRQGVDAVREIPPVRWDVEKLYDPDPESPGKMSTRWAGLLDDIDQFDPQFFGIAPKEARSMDPQQRLLLEVAWEVLENAGLAADRMVGTRTGVFVGICNNDYAHLLRSLGGEKRIQPYTGTGSAFSVASGRLSYVLGLHGPNYAVDTACSSSLVAVHLACQSLRQGECRVALAGGVNALLTPEAMVYFSKVRAMAADGRCKTFDASADGYVRGEGCGMIALKRLSDALAEGDRVLALIRGSAINHDGRTNGLTAPNGPVQERLIRDALQQAGVEPRDVSYVEAHGTGTALGDPIEVQALGSVFREGRPQNRPLLIGSVKTNIGHLEAAAGVAGLVKVVLAMQHGQIPKQLHFHEPSPHIPWDQLPVTVASAETAWPDGRRIAGVSSFGFSGTNGHVVLEAAKVPTHTRSKGTVRGANDQPDRPLVCRQARRPHHKTGTAPERSHHLLPLSAKSQDALSALAGRYGSWLKDHPQADLGDAGYTAGTGRSHLEFRAAVVVQSAEEAAGLMNCLEHGRQGTGLFVAQNKSRPKLAWMFTGQGSQYAGMAKELYQQQPTFRAVLDQCQEVLGGQLERPLLEVMFDDKALLDQTTYTQPALFALEMALAGLWRSWGVQPDVVLGHSVGQYAAACTAGVFGIEDGLRLIAQRARLMGSLPAGGAMAAVFAQADEVDRSLAQHAGLSVAAYNGSHTVLSGPAEAVDKVLVELSARGVQGQRLNTSHAFHSALIEPVLDEFESIAAGIEFKSAETTLICNLTGKPLAGEQIASAAYWRRHARQPVRFCRSLRTLAQLDCSVLLEIGPQPVLLGMAARSWPDRQQMPTLAASLRPGTGDTRQILEAAAQLHVRGITLDFSAFDRPWHRRKLSLPTYPFQRQRYWIEKATRPAVTDDRVHPLLGARLRSAGSTERRFEQRLAPAGPGWLADHQVFGHVVFPAAGYVELAAAALDRDAVLIEGLSIDAPLVLEGSQEHWLQTILKPGENGSATLEIFGQRDAAGGWTRHVSARLNVDEDTEPERPRSLDIEELKDRCGESIDPSAFYTMLATHGLQYGPMFQALRAVHVCPGEVLARVEVPGDLNSQAKHYRMPPVLLDGCFQALAAAMGEKANGDGDEVFLPIGIQRVQTYGPVSSSVWCHGRWRDSSSDRYVAELTLLDDWGNVLAEVGGLNLQRVNRQTVRRSLASRADHLMYGLSWQVHRPFQPRSAPEPGLWLHFADREASTTDSIQAFAGDGHKCVTVLTGDAFAEVDADRYTLDPCQPEHFDQLLKAVQRAGGPQLRGIVWLVGLGGHEGGSAESLVHQTRHQSGGLLLLVQALLRHDLERLPDGLHLVTSHAVAVEPGEVVSPTQSALWGLGRTIAAEQPGLGCRLLDLDCTHAPAAQLAQRLPAEGGESQMAARRGQWYVPRLVPHRKSGRLSVTAGQYQLLLRRQGTLEQLELTSVQIPVPAAGEVQVLVRAAGLNFRDLLNALGMYPGQAGPLGGEFAGQVVAVGRGVEGIAVGDRVFGIAPASFATRVNAAVTLLARLPAGLSFADGATIPVAFTTAHQAFQLAGLKAGDRVLIHAAGGGVGLAAVGLAQAVGAEVFATASASKQSDLRLLGVKHIFNSRSTEFAEEILQATGGDGVDVAVNSLTGEGFIEATLQALGPGGRMVEIAKRDIWSPERMGRERPDVDYHILALDELVMREPAQVGAWLAELAERLAGGQLRPLPHRNYPITEAPAAFRWMQQARHFGKIVLTIPTPTQPDPDASYLITGGLGGLGLKAAEWLADQGAGHLVLVGRHSPGKPAQATLKKLQAGGSTVHVRQADMSRDEDVEALCAEIAASWPPLRGVIHAAGVLDDGVVSQQSWQRFETVLAAKLRGSWNLHQATRDMPLDFFVLYSSVASLIGSPGQSNYAAANAFLDGLAQHRQARGLPALSVNWGPWADGNMAAGQVVLRQLTKHGISPLKSDAAHQALGELLANGPAGGCVLDADWNRLAPALGSAHASLLEKVSVPQVPQGDSQLIQRLRQAPASGRQAMITEHLQGELQQVLALQSAPDPETGFFDLGMDSLMAVELRNRLESQLGGVYSLSSTLLFDYPTVGALAGHLARQLLALPEPNGRPKRRPKQRYVARQDGVAVVGLACRFPGAPGTQAFWQLLEEGQDAIREVPADRWDIQTYFDPDPDTPGKMATRYGGFLEQIDRFDCQLFGIAPREAVSMDPQHRLLLEVSWEALEHAGISAASLRGSRTGVFVGISTSDYGQLLAARGEAAIDAYLGTGTAHSAGAGRISHVLGLEGPNLAIDTACSSSLVAVHQACRSILAGDCNTALAGGVNAILSPTATINFSKARMLAPDGRCKTFDASADGYVRGEGCGLVVLKRLSGAQRDGDRILAVIRGTAVNQDGASSALTVPNGPAQVRVIQDALEQAGVEPRDVDYVEAHGTGTALGDPIEVHALGKAFGEGRLTERPLLVGSVKTNIGHLEAAAGVAGLIKVVLGMQHGRIPKHLHFHEPSPHISWEQLPVKVVSEATAWPEGRQIAGVSSFGFSGTNAHVVLEAAHAFSPASSDGTEGGAGGPRAGPSVRTQAARPHHGGVSTRERSHHLLPVSAKSEDALRQLAGQYADWLQEHPTAELADVAFTAATGRSHLDVRAAVVAGSAEEAGRLLQCLRHGRQAAGLFVGQSGNRPKQAWMFAGQGSRQAVMAKDLYDSQPAFRDVLDHCQDVLRDQLERPLLEAMLEDGTLLDETTYSYPALFALEMALAELWLSWGIEPAVVLGHGVGQYAAACVSGLFGLEDGLRLVAGQARLTGRSPIDGDLAEASLDQFEALAAGIALKPAQRTLVCSVTGKPLDGRRILDAARWRQHTGRPIEFHPSLRTLAQLGCSVVLEIGPQPVLPGVVPGTPPEPQPLPTSVASLRPGLSATKQILEALGQLYVQGVTPDFQAFDRPGPQRKHHLPTYPFQRQRYWIQTQDKPVQRDQPQGAVSIDECLYQIQWQPAQPVALAETLPSEGTWLLLADERGLAGSLAALLIDRGQRCRLVRPEEVDVQSPEAFDPLLEELAASDEPLAAIVHLWSLDLAEETSKATLDRMQRTVLPGTLHLVQALARRKLTAPLWLATCGAQSVYGSDNITPAQAPLWGLGRVVRLELPELWGGLVDLTRQTDADGSQAELLLATMLAHDGEDQSAIRDGTRYLARLTRAELPQPTGPFRCSDNGTYLITGGMGALGLTTARWLVDHGARQLVLAGRSAPNDAARAAIGDFQARGCRVHIRQADVSQTEDVEGLITQIAQDLAPLRGVIHAAGVVEDGVLTNQDWERFRKVLAAKVQGAWNLHEKTQDLPLDFFMLYSSVASLLGSPAQGNYAAASAFLDALAHLRRGKGLPAMTVNWGPWAETGMAASARSQHMWQSWGIDSISPKQQLDVVGRLARGDVSQVAVLAADWDKFFSAFPKSRRPALVSAFGVGRPESRPQTQNRSDNSPVGASVKTILTAPECLRPGLMANYLQETLASVLGMKKDDVPISANILQLGLDSLMTMALVKQVEAEFSFTIYPREIYDRPTVAGLAGYLAQELTRSRGELLAKPGGAPEEVARGGAQVRTIPAGRPLPPRSGDRIPGTVFLLSTPRSGSTLLRVMLAGHSDLFAPPELHLLPFDGMAAWREELRASHLDQGLQRALMELEGSGSDESLRRIGELAEKDTPVDEVYRLLKRLAGKRQLVDKSPSYAYRLDTLRRAEHWCDRPKYVHLIRHPYAVVESFVRLRMEKLVGIESDDPFALAEEIWKSSNDNVQQFLASVDPRRWHVMRFEELVADPESAMRALAQFLEIPYREELVTPYDGSRMTDGISQHAVPIDDPNFRKRSRIDESLADAWKRVALPRPLKTETVLLATRLGYQMPNGDSPARRSPPGGDGATAIEAKADRQAPRGSRTGRLSRKLSSRGNGRDSGGLGNSSSGGHDSIFQMREQFINAQGLQLCVCSWGPSDGPTVLCLHGVLDQAVIWEPVARQLAGRGYCVVAPDSRGHGRSDHVGAGGSYHLNDLAADADAVLRSCTSRPVTVVGHSLGAAVAAQLALARHHSIDRLVLLEPPLAAGANGTSRAARPAAQPDRSAFPSTHTALEDVQAAADRLRAATPSLAAEFALRLARRTTKGVPTGVVWSWDPKLRCRAGSTWAGEEFSSARFADLLRKLPLPTTVAFGAQSNLGRDRSRHLIQRAADSCHTLRGGHCLPVDSPDDIVRIIASGQVARVAIADENE